MSGPSAALGPAEQQLAVQLASQPVQATNQDLEKLLLQVEQEQHAVELSLSVHTLDKTTQESQRFQADVRESCHHLLNIRSSVATSYEQLEAATAELREQLKHAKQQYASQNDIKLQLQQQYDRLRNDRKKQQRRLRHLHAETRQATKQDLKSSAKLLDLIEACSVYGKVDAPLTDKFEAGSGIASRIASKQVPLMEETLSQAQDTLQDKKLLNEAAAELNGSRMEQACAALRNQAEEAAAEVKRLPALEAGLVRYANSNQLSELVVYVNVLTHCTVSSSSNYSLLREGYNQLVVTAESSVGGDFDCSNCHQPQEFSDLMNWGAAILTPIRQDIGLIDAANGDAADQSNSQSTLESEQQGMTSWSQAGDEPDPEAPTGFTLFNGGGHV